MSRKTPPRLQNRRTPRWLFCALEQRFGRFSLDAFATSRDALCPRFLTRREDGTRHAWLDRTYANPPFKLMAEALAQAVREAERERRSIVLGPVGCSQEWFHELAIRGTVYKLDRRVNYDLPNGQPTTSADRDTDIFAFGGEHTNPDWRRGSFRVRRLELER